MNNRRISIFGTVGILFGFLLSGCAMMGGGTSGTGYPAIGGGTSGTGLPFGGVPTKADEAGVSYFNLEGSVHGANGKPLEGVSVRVETTRDHDTTESGPDGTFDVSVVARQGESISFTFSGAGLSEQFRYIEKKTPANISGAHFDFVLGKQGKVILRKKSFSTGTE